MNRLLNSRKFVVIIFAIVAVAFADCEARGNQAYLSDVGSPPLRFEAVSTNHLVFDLKSLALMAKPAKTSDTASPPSVPAVNVTNVVTVTNLISSSSANTNQPAAMLQSASAGKNNSETPVISPNLSSSASDLLTVTPQMIAQYLQPSQKTEEPADRRNQPGNSVFVPVEMQFAPPAPAAPAKSQAVYNNFNTQ
jgi:hypothetical protein